MAARQACWFGCLTAVVLVVGCLVPAGAAQRTKECEKTPSAIPDKVDVSCNCMQRLTKVEVDVEQLTINQTGCARSGLELNWPKLEAEVAPSKLVLVGARVYFAEGRPAAPWTPSITAIHFINCSFVEVPARAFRDLQLLEEVRMVGGAAAVVRSGAFSGLSRLRVVEAVNASLGVLEGGAWASLPELKDIALVHCYVGEVQSLAVNLTRSDPVGGDGQSCQPARSPDRSRVLDVLSGRQRAAGTGNLSLPEFGSQLLLFKNNIGVVEPQAFTGDALGFLIMGSNEVGRMETSALDLELHNPCEISAALLVGNTIARVEDGAMVGLRGKLGAPRRTFLALSNNTWDRVKPQAFTLHENIAVFSGSDNRFRCRCDLLQWTVSQATTAAQQDLQEALLADGVCHDGSRLSSFTSSCHNPPTPPSHIIPPPTPKDTSTRHPSLTTSNPSPSSSPSPSPTPTTNLPPSYDPSTTPQTTFTPEPPSPSGAPLPTFTPEPPSPSGAPLPTFTSATLLTLVVARLLR